MMNVFFYFKLYLNYTTTIPGKVVAIDKTPNSFIFQLILLIFNQIFFNIDKINLY